MTTTIPPTWRAAWVERWRTGPGLPSLLFGVLLPLGTLVFELVTGLCAQALFDPMPTLLHLTLVALVPVCNFFVWFSFRRTRAHSRVLAFANGLSIGVAALYSILFLPLLPFATVAILYFGLGLLPWTPPLALIAALCLRAHLKRDARQQQRQLATWPGVVCGVLALIAADLPYTLTAYGMHLATSPTPAQQTRGIRLLRQVGNEDSMLRFCYVRTGRATDMVSLLTGMREVDPSQARNVYYRVTGDVFTAKPEPKNLHRKHWMRWDADQGTDTVGARLEGLSLASSRFDGSIDASAALGYLEWTLIMKNETSTLREARAQVALPPGAVVSRLTLWVNGEEREAAFAGRGQVTEAYRNVVASRRDPVLVTTAGADRIAVQMFPVPAHGEMKVRIGMTTPLQLDDLHQGTLQLPYFHERNFEVAQTLEHSVWIDANAVLKAGRHESSVVSGTDHSLQLQLTDSELSATSAVIAASRDHGTNSWSHDTTRAGPVIKQVLEVVPASPPSRLAIVIDSSASLAHFVQPLAEAVSQLPSQLELFVFFADDATLTDAAAAPISPIEAATSIRTHEFIGGEDNTLTLARALDKVLTVQNSALVWVHGPQPVILQTTDPIEQRLERRGQVRWYDVQVKPGANRIGERLDGRANIQALSLSSLRTLFTLWHTGGNEIVVHRDRLPRVSSAGPASEQTSGHLARLWANDEVKRMLYVERAPRESIIELAHTYQLVTPVTGAVVLETQQQFDAAGLTPVPEGTVPSIPEPEEWLLMIVAAFILLYAWSHRRLVGRHASI